MSSCVGLLQGAHALIALRRDEPHWLLNDTDAKGYGQALQNALRHIPIKRAQKTLDFAMLAIAAGNCEIPRIYMSSQIAKARRQGTAPRAQVFQFRQSPSPPPPPAGVGPTYPSDASPPPSAGGTSNGGGARTDMSIEPELDEPRFGPQ